MRCLYTLAKYLLSILFSRLNIPSLTASPCVSDAPNLLSFVWPFAGLFVVCLSHAEKRRTGPSTPAAVSSGLNREKGSSPLICWQCILRMLSAAFARAHWCSCSTWCPPAEQLFKQWSLGLFLPRCKTFHFPFFEHHEGSASPISSLSSVPLRGSTAIWFIINCSSKFCVICELAEGALFQQLGH